MLFVLRVWGPTESHRLADEAGITDGTLTGVMKTLEQRGLKFVMPAKTVEILPSPCPSPATGRGDALDLPRKSKTGDALDSPLPVTGEVDARAAGEGSCGSSCLSAYAEPSPPRDYTRSKPRNPLAA